MFAFVNRFYKIKYCIINKISTILVYIERYGHSSKYMDI